MLMSQGLCLFAIAIIHINTHKHYNSHSLCFAPGKDTRSRELAPCQTPEEQGLVPPAVAQAQSLLPGNDQHHYVLHRVRPNTGVEKIWSCPMVLHQVKFTDTSQWNFGVPNSVYNLLCWTFKRAVESYNVEAWLLPLPSLAIYLPVIIFILYISSLKHVGVLNSVQMAQVKLKLSMWKTEDEKGMLAYDFIKSISEVVTYC